LNMGIFLRTGGEFLVMVTGMNVRYLEITMTALLLLVAVYTILGGMLSVLITDFLQFIVMSLGLILVLLLILYKIGWSTLVAAVETHYGAGGFNPFVHPQMGLSYVFFNIILGFAGVLTWQTTIARLLAAKDTKTGLSIYKGTAFFFVCRFIIPGIWGIAALAVLNPESFGHNSLYAMPKFLATFVPSGLGGILIAAMLAADMSTDSSYMLTWSSVIYNDIMAPFRKTTWSEKKGIFWNRFIVAMIGIFLLFYGLWYPLKDNLWTYLSVTATIYLSSMSVLLIACCYWKRANSWGAGAAILFGAIIPTAFLVMQQVPATQKLAAVIGPYRSGIASYVMTSLAMIVGSLLKPQQKGQ
jgi:solute:Na+ symporter, SSS family